MPERVYAICSGSAVSLNGESLVTLTMDTNLTPTSGDITPIVSYTDSLIYAGCGMTYLAETRLPHREVGRCIDCGTDLRLHQNFSWNHRPGQIVCESCARKVKPVLKARVFEGWIEL